MTSNIVPSDLVRPVSALSFDAVTGDQALKLKDVRSMLCAYNDRLMTAHELITRIYAETGYQVQVLERDAARLSHVVSTELGDVIVELVIGIEEKR